MRYFGVGTIIDRIRDGKPTSIYTVQNINGLVDVIIPHFKKYSLIGQKHADFLLFSDAVAILKNVKTKDLEVEDIRKILSFKGSMGKNKGLSPKINELYPDIVLADRIPIVTKEIPSPFWLAGFASGEGMFYIKPKEIGRYSYI